jgi:hypothetical protein
MVRFSVPLQGLGRKLTSSVYWLLHRGARLIPSWVLRVKAVYILQLDREHWRPPTDTQAIRWATGDDLGRLKDMTKQPPAGVGARVARGGRAVIRVDGDDIIGCVWFEPTAPLYKNWLQLLLSESEQWISDTYVVPQRRGEGISSQLSSYGRAQLPDHVIRVGAITNALNASVRRVAENAGYESVRIWYFRLLGLTIAKLPSGWQGGWWRSERPLLLPLAELRHPDA